MTRLSEQLIDQTFIRLAGIYGHLWTSQFSDARILIAARAEWAHALGLFTAEQLSRAINTASRTYDKPPTLPQFARLCGSRDPMHQPAALPAPPRRAASPETIARHIYELKGARRAGFRSVLNGGGFAGYQIDKAEALRAGKTAAEFDAERLAANGRTPEHESRLALHAARLGYRLP